MSSTEVYIKMSDKIQIKDNLSLTVGKIADIKFLIEIIRENYFNQYNVNAPSDYQAIIWEHRQAKALFNILADNLENIFKTIENINNDLKEF